MSIGRNRRVHSSDLATLFTSADGVTESDLGQVKVLDNYSFVELTFAAENSLSISLANDSLSAESLASPEHQLKTGEYQHEVCQQTGPQND